MGKAWPRQLERALELKPLAAFANALTSAKPPPGAAKFAKDFDIDAAVVATQPWDGKDGVAPVEEPLEDDEKPAAAGCDVGADSGEGKCTAPPPA